MSFLKNLFRNNKTNKSEFSESLILVTINDKIMPIDRGEIYEDPLDDYIQANRIGEVTGGGTLQKETGEIEYCDIEIRLNDEKIIDNDIKLIIDKLEELGAPKGSKLTIKTTDQTIQFGKKEGLGIYLDGVNLDADVYKNSDSNVVVSEIKRLVNDNSEIVRYWEGENETGLYFYSDSFDKMTKSINEFLNKYPLCKGARIERIA